MTTIEALTAILGLFIGYWAVSRFIGKSSTSNSNKKQHQQSESSHDKSNASSYNTYQPSWHEILNISASANHDEIRSAYKKLMKQYHPDKVSHLGEELRLLADQKSKEITNAYQEAMRLHGK